MPERALDDGDSEEDVDLERLDISDFLEPDVGVRRGGLGEAAPRRGGGGPSADANRDGSENEGTSLEPLDVADFLEPELGGGEFRAEAGAGVDDDVVGQVERSRAPAVVEKQQQQQQQHGGGGFEDGDGGDVWYDDGSPEDGEPTKAATKRTTGGGPGDRRGGGGEDGRAKGGFEGLSADEVRMTCSENGSPLRRRSTSGMCKGRWWRALVDRLTLPTALARKQHSLKTCGVPCVDSYRVVGTCSAAPTLFRTIA